MSLSSTCDAIASISDTTTLPEVIELAKQCETHLAHICEVMDTVENSLSTSSSVQRLMLWMLIDRLAKQHTLFLEALRSKMLYLATHYAPSVGSKEWPDFVALLKSSFAVLLGNPLVSLILMQLSDEGGGSEATSAEAPRRTTDSHRSKTALTLHNSALRSAGAFMTKAIAIERPAAHKHTLQVKTLDSQMAMNVASSYAPAKPVELLVPEMRADSDAPRGYMKALPADYHKSYEEVRRKRLRDIMQRNREEQDLRHKEELLRSVRGAARDRFNSDTPGDSGAVRDVPDYSDIVMPLELPRDEFGVKRGNFPLGVRFIRNAIESCGGAIELDVLVNRISTLSSREAVAEFGNVREFLLIHSPTFRLVNEKDQLVVRLTNQGDMNDLTWESMQCPSCSKVVKGRNFARHHNSRKCITTQIALGLQGDYQDRGPIAELAFMAKHIISRRDTYDDGDLDMFAECIKEAAAVRRFKLGSQRQFAPIMKAMRVVRDRWLMQKGVEEMADAVVDSADASVANLFRTFGSCVHRLPIGWIEMGDVINMCQRFTHTLLPPFNPPPRPADPRISLQNEYPGFLLCESEIDDDDDPSGDEDEFSDDEAPTFNFAPPVGTAESLFTAGFERDTRRLQHRMRTAPPMVLQRVLQGDRNQTQQEMYTGMENSSANAVFGNSHVRSV